VAEIKVEPRRGGFKWWWLLPLLLIPLFLLFRGRDHDEATPVVTDTTTVAPAPVSDTAYGAATTTPVTGTDTTTGTTGAGAGGTDTTGITGADTSRTGTGTDSTPRP
jgi:hypothetical protein